MNALGLTGCEHIVSSTSRVSYMQGTHILLKERVMEEVRM